MKRRLFAILAALSLLACLLCVANVVNIAIVGPGNFIHWDQRAGQWTSDPAAQDTAVAWTSAALAPVFVIAPVVWLRRFLAEQRKRNLVWRGRCGSCGYDVRASPGRCPECGALIAPPTPSQAPHTGRIGPGTKAMALLFVMVPIVAAVAFALIWYLCFLLSDGV